MAPTDPTAHGGPHDHNHHGHTMTARLTGQRPKPPTKAERFAPDVARLVEKGMSRNKIATELGCSAGTVTAAARVAGVEFDRAATSAATEAAVIDAKTDRALIEAKVRTRAHEALDALDMSVPTDARALATVFGILVDKSLKIAQFDSIGGTTIPDALQWLQQMRGDGTALGALPDSAQTVAEFGEILHAGSNEW